MSEGSIDNGRLHYFEPATIAFDNMEGNLSDSITFPYDKYNIAVDLRVIVNDRYSCGLSNENGESTEYLFSTTGGTLSFLGGTDGYLTTNYTDVQNITPNQNTQECLGIESINISYDSWLHPTVVVKFIDVRGATVMQPADQNYYNEGEQGYTYKLYKSLFTFPYPLFIMKVKGFYGKGATYRLAVSKVDIDFDARTGNFAITVNFIGHIYGFFADIPVSYLAVAPYTKDGDEYWKEMTNSSSKRFWFHEIDSAGNEVPTCPMPKLPELAIKVAQVECAQNIIYSESEAQIRIQDKETEIQMIGDIITTYHQLFDHNYFDKTKWDTAPFGENYNKDDNQQNFRFAYFDDDSKYPSLSYVFIGGDDTLVTNQNVYIRFANFIEALNRKDEKFSTSSMSTKNMFPYIEDWIGEFRNSYYFTFSKNESNRVWGWDQGVYANTWTTSTPDNLRAEVSHAVHWALPIHEDKNDYYSDDLNSFIRACISKKGFAGMTRFRIFAFTKGSSLYKDSIASLERYKSSLEKQMEPLREDLRKKNESLIEQALGFRPSIKNIFDLMFAHLDTFVHVYYNHLKVIKNELKSTDEKRKKITYSIKDGFTDTEPAGKGLAMRGDYLPPFAGYYEEWKDENGSTVKREMWPGNLPGNPESNLEEIKFVYDLLNGSKLYFEEIQAAIPIIEQYRQNGTTIGNGEAAPLTSTVDFIPVTIFDVANNGKYPNPYKSVAEKINSNASFEEIFGEFCLIFSLREYYYMQSAPDDTTDRARAIGRVDAINFYKAVGVPNYSPGFIKFIRTFADDSHYGSDEDTYIGAITRTTSDLVTKTWQFGLPNTNDNLFSMDSDVLDYKLSKTETSTQYCYFPMYITDSNQLKNDFSNGNETLRQTRRYISKTFKDQWSNNGFAIDDFKIGQTYHCGTFLLYESKTYINDLYSNIFAELTREKADTDDEDVKKLLDIDFDVFRGSKTYNYLFEGIGSVEKALDRGVFVRYNAEDEKYEKAASSESEYLEIINGNDSDVAIKYMDENSLYDSTIYKSIYEEPFYWLQENILAKAFLFLQTLPMNFIGTRDTSKIDEYGRTLKDNALIQKVSLLKEGSLYWWEQLLQSGNEDTVFIRDGDVKEFYTVLDTNKNPSPIGKKGGNYVCYILPEIGYMFKNNCRKGIVFSSSDGGVVSYNVRIPQPIGSKSRYKYLIEYFKNWVLDSTNPYSFCNVVSALENLRIREKNTVGLYTYSNPLDLGLLTKGVSNGNNDAMDAKKVQGFLHDLFIGVCTVFEYYGGCYHNNTMTASRSDFETGFDKFMTQLNLIYGRIANSTNNQIGIALQERGDITQIEDPFKSDDLRLSTYMTLKSLYDKWICGSVKGENSWKVNTKPLRVSKISHMTNRNYVGYVNDDSGLYELDTFIYMDSLYRDIGHKLKVNLSKLSDWLTKSIPGSNSDFASNVMNYNSKSLYEFLTEVAQDCGGLILAIPQRFIYNNADDIKTIFTPIPSCEQWDDNSYTYMFLYNYRPSEHLGDVSTSNMDMNGWSPDGDGFSLTDSDIIGELFGGADDGYGIPAFGVTFGKGNQSYFKDIKLSTGQFGVTEAGLNATFQIAAKSSDTVRQTTLYGQDIYKVYSNNAYECTVEMMGDMQIFPPMYFQLNNIPMWKGAYMIKKVTHTITPGDAKTTIVGVRQNKYLIPFTNGDIVSFVEANPRDLATQQLNVSGEIGETGDVVNKEQNLSHQINVDESDFKPENITKTKPLICITPAHGPKTQKKLENAWSKKLIDEYIIPRLREKKFKDGTSYSDNIHRCNKNDANTSSNGYSLSETRNLIDKYGSEYVISIVPHWNGCGGNRLCVFYGQVNRANCTQYQLTNKDGSLKFDRNGNPVYWWKNCGKPLYKRPDSKIFADYVRAAGEIVVQNAKNGTIKKAPDGMLEYVTYEDGKTDVFNYLLTPNCTDGAVQQNCACILTENFFADYCVNGVAWDGPNYKELDSEGKYQTGRAWLESEEGLSAIADMHVLGIVNYINSLEEGGNRQPQGVNTTYNGTYNIDNACNYLRTHIHNLNPNPAGHSNTKHDCATHVRWAIEAGYNDSHATDGRPDGAKDYHNEGFLSRIGFHEVTSFKSDEIDTSGYVPAKGDIAVYEKPKNPNWYGHICMYDGSSWYSYWKQSSIWCYGTASGASTIHVYRINDSATGTTA